MVIQTNGGVMTDFLSASRDICGEESERQRGDDTILSEEICTETQILCFSPDTMDFNRMSPSTTMRAQEIMNRWESGQYSYILVMGGYWKHHDSQERPAALVLRDWLLRAGVFADRILLEDSSLDLYQEVQFGLKVIRFELERHSWIHGFNLTICTTRSEAIRFKVILMAEGIKAEYVYVHATELTWTSWFLGYLLVFYTVYDVDGTGYWVQRNRKRIIFTE